MASQSASAQQQQPQHQQHHSQDQQDQEPNSFPEEKASNNRDETDVLTKQLVEVKNLFST